MACGSWFAADLPTWLAGVGTVGTAGVAVYVLRREQTDREGVTQQQRRAQARRVAVSEPEARSSSANGAVVSTAYEVSVVNAGDEVVNSCRVRWIAHATVAVHGEEPWAEVHAQEIGRILPGETETRVQWFGIPQDGSGAIAHEVAAEALFYDGAGVRWLRATDHLLTEVAGNDPW